MKQKNRPRRDNWSSSNFKRNNDKRKIIGKIISAEVTIQSTHAIDWHFFLSPVSYRSSEDFRFGRCEFCLKQTSQVFPSSFSFWTRQPQRIEEWPPSDHVRTFEKQSSHCILGLSCFFGSWSYFLPQVLLSGRSIPPSRMYLEKWRRRKAVGAWWDWLKTRKWYDSLWRKTDKDFTKLCLLI